MLLTTRPPHPADGYDEVIAEVKKALTTAPAAKIAKPASPGVTNDGVSNLALMGLGAAPEVPSFSERYLVAPSSSGDVVDVPTPAGTRRTAAGTR